jgi:hypothetical protein
MKAGTLSAHGSTDKLEWSDVPGPSTRKIQ